jgi:xylulose-5-phosphate/fructose-6-phosphate phosphoketolase
MSSSRDKQKHLQYMSIDDAIAHCTKGIGIWSKASNDEGTEPDVVMACAGDIPTKEALRRWCCCENTSPI